MRQLTLSLALVLVSCGSSSIGDGPSANSPTIKSVSGSALELVSVETEGVAVVPWRTYSGALIDANEAETTLRILGATETTLTFLVPDLPDGTYRLELSGDLALSGSLVVDTPPLAGEPTTMLEDVHSALSALVRRLDAAATPAGVDSSGWGVLLEQLNKLTTDLQAELGSTDQEDLRYLARLVDSNQGMFSELSPPALIELPETESTEIEEYELLVLALTETNRRLVDTARLVLAAPEGATGGTLLSAFGVAAAARATESLASNLRERAFLLDPGFGNFAGNTRWAAMLYGGTVYPVISGPIAFPEFTNGSIEDVRFIGEFRSLELGDFGATDDSPKMNVLERLYGETQGGWRELYVALERQGGLSAVPVLPTPYDTGAALPSARYVGASHPDVSLAFEVLNPELTVEAFERSDNSIGLQFDGVDPSESVETTLFINYSLLGLTSTKFDPESMERFRVSPNLSQIDVRISGSLDDNSPKIRRTKMTFSGELMGTVSFEEEAELLSDFSVNPLFNRVGSGVLAVGDPAVTASVYAVVVPNSTADEVRGLYVNLRANQVDPYMDFQWEVDAPPGDSVPGDAVISVERDLETNLWTKMTITGSTSIPVRAGVIQNSAKRPGFCEYEIIYEF